MNFPQLVLLVCCAVVLKPYSSIGQNNSELAYMAGATANTSHSARTVSSGSLRNCKKLSATYTGLAIEVAISNYPLDSEDSIFRLFGNIHYYKHVDGWYSYLILASFSSKQAALDFMGQVIKPNVPEARLIEYKEGNRKVLQN